MEVLKRLSLLTTDVVELRMRVVLLFDLTLCHSLPDLPSCLAPDVAPFVGQPALKPPELVDVDFLFQLLHSIFIA